MNRTTRPRRPARHRPIVEVLEGRALLALAGTINPTFAGTGSVAIPVLPSNSPPTANASGSTLSAVESNGAVVLAGTYADSGLIYETIQVLNANGSPSTSFGAGGRATFQVGTVATTSGAAMPQATALVVQPNGTIDLAGGFAGQTSTINPTFGVIQVTPSGLLDSAFGNKGVATLPGFAPNQDPLYTLSAMTLTPSGQLIVAGNSVSSTNSNDLELYVARLNSNGSIDTTFGTSGFAMAFVSIDDVTEDHVAAVTLQPSGRILVAGYASGGKTVAGQSPTLNLVDGLVVGFTSTGVLDTTFGGASAQGEVILRPDPANPSALGNRSIYGLTLQPNNAIVLAGTNAVTPNGSTTTPNPIGQLTRLNADGTIDASFGVGGTVTFTNGLIPYGVTVQSNGLILVPGVTQSTGAASTYVASVARYNADGTPDVTFGSVAVPGLATFEDPIAQGLFTTASITPTGQILMGGTIAYPDSTTHSYVPNFLAIQLYPIIPVESEAPANFDGSGRSNLAVYLPSVGSFVYRPTNGSADVIVPFGLSGAGQTIPVPGDYNGSGQTEIAAYLPSLGLYAYRPANGGPDVIQAFGIPGTGQSIPAPGDYFGTGVDDLAVYLPSVGVFAIRNPNGGADEIIPFGNPGPGQSIPAPGDYFGTGQTDIAVYLPASGTFAIRNPTTGIVDLIQFGIPGTGNSIPIPGDYDGSGKTELAVYLPKVGKFAYRPANGGADVIIAFGSAGDGSIAVPGDYTGSGHLQIGLYDPNYGDFAYRPGNGAGDVIEIERADGKRFMIPMNAQAVPHWDEDALVIAAGWYD